MEKKKVLFADDEIESLSKWFPFLGDATKRYEFFTAKTPQDCLAQLRKQKMDCLLLDLSFTPGREEGLDLLKQIRESDNDLPIIMLTGNDDYKYLAKCMKLGATDFLSKFKQSSHKNIIEKIDQTFADRESAALQDAAGKNLANLVGAVYKSNAIEKVYALAYQAKMSPESNVLIEGPTGAGKELVAKAIAISPAKNRPYIVFNCALVTPELANTQLFGHEKGSFTGADKSVKGHFELADGGDIFLDEVDSLPLEAQAKLLRVLQQGEIQKLGSQSIIKTKVRVIAATNQKLWDAVQEGRFREDLYHRLSQLTITIPPLSQRPEDVPCLARHFITKYKSDDMPIDSIPSISGELETFLKNFSWPGNTRQLENTIRTMIRGTNAGGKNTLSVSDLPKSLFQQDDTPDIEQTNLFQIESGLPIRIAKEKFEREYVRLAARHFKARFRKGATTRDIAEVLGVSKSAAARYSPILKEFDRD